MNRFEKTKQILDDAVGGQDFAAHGAFWRGLTRDQFVVHSVFGFPLLSRTNDGGFIGVGSNLVKALKGEAPFGSDVGTAGALFRRMPGGRDPVPADRIEFISNWIDDGCPEDEIEAVPVFDFDAGGVVDGEQHNDYWRDFDDWASFQAVPDVRRDIGAVMQVAPRWMAFAEDAAKEPAWQQAVGTTRNAALRLAKRQIDTISRHYGDPVQFVTLLDSYERFGDDSLPDDPQRPVDSRHNMNGQIMWFFWCAMSDTILRAASDHQIVAFWNGHVRAILLGLMNDGLFRQRFSVVGFTADEQGKADMRTHVKDLADDDLQPEMSRRLRDSGVAAFMGV